MKIQRPVGTYDLTPQDSAVWRGLEARIRGLFQRYNYGEIRTPIFEYTELFKRGVGESSDIVTKEMYTFPDQGGRSLTLRPEGTAAVVRAFLENGLAKQSPGVTKLWYLAPMFRYERKQKGRFRQHVQYGCEVFGAEGPEVDLEILVMLHRFYQSLGLTQLDLKINSVGTPKCRPRHREAFTKFVQPKLVRFCEDCHKRYEINPLRMFDCKNESCQKELEGAPLLIDCLDEESEAHFNAVCRGLEAFGIAYQIDPKLVRGLDYYTRTAFEMSYAPLGSQGVLVGGGRYDGLVESLGGPATPGIGFGAGMERLVLILKECGIALEASQALDIYVVALGERAQLPAARVIEQCRAFGYCCERDFAGKSFRKQLQAADKLGARYALVIGDDEIDQSKLIVKDLRQGTQEEIAWDEVLTELTKIVSTTSLSFV